MNYFLLFPSLALLTIGPLKSAQEPFQWFKNLSLEEQKSILQNKKSLAAPKISAQPLKPDYWSKNNLPTQQPAIFTFLSQLSPEIKQEVLSKYSSLDLLKLYDFLEKIHKEGPAERARIEIMGVAQAVAAGKIGKILGCTPTSLLDRTCQPLKNSQDPKMSPEYKQRRPFEEVQEPWAQDFVRLLPVVEIFNESSQIKYETWKIEFLHTMYDFDLSPKTYITITERGKRVLVLQTGKEILYDPILRSIYAKTLPLSLQDALVRYVEQHRMSNTLDLEIRLTHNPAHYTLPKEQIPHPFAKYHYDSLIERLKQLKAPALYVHMSAPGLFTNDTLVDLSYQEPPAPKQKTFYSRLNELIMLKNS